MTGSRRLPLSWGQRYMWLAHQRLAPDARHELNIVARYEPPAGATVRTLRLALNHLVRRHQGLRTTFHPDGPHQQVHPPRPLAIDCVDLADRSPGEVNRLVTAFNRRAFDLESEPPIRALLVTDGSVPTALNVVLHHVAVDDWSMQRLHADLDRVHADVLAERPVTLPARPQPADAVAVEQEPGLGDAALTWWRQEAATAPTDPFGRHRTPPAPELPVAVSASLSSPAAQQAARQLSERYGTWPSMVYLAAFVAVLHRYSGLDRVPVQVYGANRDDEWQRELLAPSFLPVPMTVDCSGEPTLATLVEQVVAGSEAALAHSHYPYDRALEILAEEESRRGRPVGPPASFNYLNHPTRQAGVRRTVLRRNAVPEGWSGLGEDAYFRLYEWRDCAVAVLNAQGTVMTADAAQWFLRGFETVLVGPAGTDPQRRPVDLVGPWPGGTAAGAAPLAWPAPVRSDGSDAARDALVAAVRAANDLDTVDPGHGYVAAGGRILRVPHLLDLLARAGWSGVGVAALTGGAPLAEIAGRLVPQPAPADPR
ncbi:condensation domain-containing protein [Micromonospora echinospora]|uniref:condensation domain-containing protein n=1 Tax=Micromonospora echinospora TaxID=1877 RepID=UPI00379AC7CF